MGIAAGLGGCLDGPASRRTISAESTTNRTPTPAERGETPVERSECTPPDGEWSTPGRSSLAAPSAVESAPGDCPATEHPVFRRLCSGDWSGRRVCEATEGTNYRVVCSNAVEEDVPLAMAPESDELELPGTLSFVLVNGTDARFATNYYSWRLWKRERGLWYHVVPFGWPSPLMYLEPGTTYRYCLSMDDSSAAGEPVDGFYGVEPEGEDSFHSLRIPALGGGEYAFGLYGEFEGDEDADADQKTGCIARFSLRGRQIELTGSGQVEDLSVVGNRATGRWIPPDGSENDGRGVFGLRRVDGGASPRPLITEQLVRQSREAPVRDAVVIAREHDVDEVRLEGPGDGTLSFGASQYPFEYDGQVYVTKSEVLETPEPEPTEVDRP